ncbi:dCTP deaminase, dUMP-forming [uncultured archaeon]|nr:dCTP deaminase, dUMP-forming [uncultured archaeon]
MILSDKDIRAAIKKNEIKVTPFVEENVQPASVDLTLGNKIRIFRKDKYFLIDVKESQNFTDLIDVKDSFILHPGEFILGSTNEIIGLSGKFTARVEGKSSLGRIGVITHATAGFIDPGFEGNITLELGNVGSLPVKLYPGMKIAQISFLQMSSEPEKLYGEGKLNSKYKGDKGPVESRIHLNFKK